MGWGALIVAGFVAGWLAVRRHFRRLSARWAAFFAAAARQAGLTSVKRSADGIVGCAGPLRVRIATEAVDTSRGAVDNSDGVEITVSGPALPAGLTVSTQSIGPELGGEWTARWGKRELELGDRGFDEVAWVQGPSALALAVLDAPARRALRALCAARVVNVTFRERADGSESWVWGKLEGGALHVHMRFVGGVNHLADVLEEAIALARQLTAPADVARRIADNLKSEPVPGVRRAGLRVLLGEFRDHPATREALLGAREDPDADVRLQAGIALGREGSDVLRGVAADEQAADETAERAVVELGPELTLDEARGLLGRALRARRVRLATACMAALGRLGGAEAIALLDRVLGVERGELGAAAARALAGTHDPAAEPLLLRALAEGSDDVRLAAASALGEVGTAAAVPELRQAEEGDAEMRRTARQAVARIKERLTGAEPGQLSIAGTEAGALSLAGSEAGALSLASSRSAERAR